MVDQSSKVWSAKRSRDQLLPHSRLRFSFCVRVRSFCTSDGVPLAFLLFHHIPCLAVLGTLYLSTFPNKRLNKIVSCELYAVLCATIVRVPSLFYPNLYARMKRRALWHGEANVPFLNEIQPCLSANPIDPSTVTVCHPHPTFPFPKPPPTPVRLPRTRVSLQIP